jgi:integrase
MGGSTGRLTAPPLDSHMAGGKEIPAEIRALIPQSIEKGVYYRLYPRKDGTVALRWWVTGWSKTGAPIQQSARSSRYEDAVRLKKKLIAQVESGSRRGGEADQVRISELLEDLLDGGTQAKRETLYIYRLVIEKHLRPFFGKIRASKLTTDHLKQYRRRRKSELIAKRIAIAEKKGLQVTEAEQLAWERSAGATVNRELARLRTALELGRRHTPPKVNQIPVFPTESEKDNVRKVVLRDQHYERVRDSFDDPGVRLLFVVSSHTGMRASELRRVRWDQIDFERKLIVLERGATKNGHPRSAPIFGDMLRFLTEEKHQRDEFYPDSPWVFSRAGKPMGDFRGEWAKATCKGGVPDLHFHDLRRTAQRLMRRAGIDKITRMRIMGHKTDAMDIRYGVVEDDDVVAAGEKLEHTFQAMLSRSSGENVTACPTNQISAELLAKLATVPEEKLRALMAILA